MIQRMLNFAGSALRGETPLGGESRRFIISLILIAMTSVIATAQQSQTLRDRDPDLSGAKKLAADLQQANFHVGSLYLMSRIRISDAGFSGSSAVPTGGDNAGFSLAVEAPQRLYFVPTKKVILSAEVVPGYAFFTRDQREGEEDNSGQFNYLLRGDAHFLMNHLYLDLYAQRADQLRAHVAELNRVATTREDETGLAGEWKYSSRTSGVFNLRYRTTAYPADRYQPDLVPGTDFNPIELLDRNERNGRFSFIHKTFPLTSLFVSTEISNYSFEKATYKDSRRTWVGAGALYDSGRTQLRIEGGPMKLDFEDPTQRDFSGVAAAAQATRANGRTTYRASAQRDLGFSIFEANNYFVSDILTAGVDYVASRRITLRGGTAWQRDTYDVPVGGNDRRDTTSFTSVGLIYSLRMLRFGGDVGWYQRDSTYAGDVDSGIRYVVHLSFTP
jgi:hypothetical protein